MAAEPTFEEGVVPKGRRGGATFAALAEPLSYGRYFSDSVFTFNVKGMLVTSSVPE